jgi:hypothetical protein
MSSSCGDGGRTTKYGTDRLSVPKIVAKACYEPLRYQWIWNQECFRCVFHGEFFRAAPAACSFIPLRPKAGNSVAHAEAPAHMLRRGASAGASRFTEIPGSLQLFPGSAEKFPGLVPTGNRRQTIDKTREISGEPTSSDAESNGFPVIFPLHGNSSGAGIPELSRWRRGSARSPRRCPTAPNRPAHPGAW